MLDDREVANRYYLPRISTPRGRLTATAPKSIMKGAFVPFDGVEPSDDDASDEGSGDETTNNEKKKRKQSWTPPRRSKKRKLECAACRGRTHKTENCYYLFPDEAPSDFRVNERVKKEVEKRLKSDKKLR